MPDAHLLSLMVQNALVASALELGRFLHNFRVLQKLIMKVMQLCKNR